MASTFASSGSQAVTDRNKISARVSAPARSTLQQMNPRQREVDMLQPESARMVGQRRQKV